MNSHFCSVEHHVPWRAPSARQNDAGFSMLEVLVTLVILLIGLLGLAGVMAHASTAEMESYQRVQAIMLAQDMLDRMNGNRKYIACYSNGGAGLTLGTGAGTIPACAASGSATLAAERTRADTDLAEWNALLLGAAEQASGGGTNFGAMLGARGCITQVDAANSIYRVSVAWQGMAGTVAPPLDTCGQNAYGAENRRRVVTMTIRVAKLT